MLLEWVPIAMPQKAIKPELKASFGIILKIADKKHSYGLHSVTCKCCGDAGHVQLCCKRTTDFPALTRSKPRESSAVLPVTNVHSEPVNPLESNIPKMGT